MVAKIQFRKAMVLQNIRSHHFTARCHKSDDNDLKLVIKPNVSNQSTFSKFGRP